LGINSNNAAELWALIKGLQIAQRLQFKKLIAEGDSNLIIHLITKLQWGTAASKLSGHCRLEAWICSPWFLLPSIPGLVASHVKRNANKVADLIANAIFDNPLESIDIAWDELPSQSLKQSTLSLAKQIFFP
jgi:ribonuclease HI